MVTIQADKAGLQLAKFGDVRRHGALVGHVREIGNDGKQAVIKVALVPSAAKNIPENIGVEILPTTLFGQKYISIVDPTDPSDEVAERRRRDPRRAGAAPTSSSRRSWPTCSRCCARSAPPT